MDLKLFTNKFTHYLYNVFIDIDKTFSAIFLGDPNETISSRLGKAHRGDYGKTWYALSYITWGVVNCIFTPWGGWGHCERAIVEAVGNNAIVLIKI